MQPVQLACADARAPTDAAVAAALSDLAAQTDKLALAHAADAAALHTCAFLLLWEWPLTAMLLWEWPLTPMFTT